MSQCCPYVRVRFRHRKKKKKKLGWGWYKHSRKLSKVLFKHLALSPQICLHIAWLPIKKPQTGNSPKVSLKRSSGFTVTNTETRFWTAVTGLAALLTLRFLSEVVNMDCQSDMKHFVDMSIRCVAVVCRNVSCHMLMHCHLFWALNCPRSRLYMHIYIWRKIPLHKTNVESHSNQFLNLNLCLV